MECYSVSVGEPITWIQRQEFNFGSLWQIAWFINQQPTGTHLCLDRHGASLTAEG